MTMHLISQLLVTVLAMSLLLLVWFGMQRLMRTSDECDYMEGRWGCADCEDASCVLKPGARSQSPTP